MKHDTTKLQSELIDNILSDPGATREAKLMALMGDRQLALFESILELQQGAERARTSRKELSQRVTALEERMRHYDARCSECPYEPQTNTRSDNAQDECG